MGEPIQPDGSLLSLVGDLIFAGVIFLMIYQCLRKTISRLDRDFFTQLLQTGEVIVAIIMLCFVLMLLVAQQMRFAYCSFLRPYLGSSHDDKSYAGVLLKILVCALLVANYFCTSGVHKLARKFFEYVQPSETKLIKVRARMGQDGTMMNTADILTNNSNTNSQTPVTQTQTVTRSDILASMSTIPIVESDTQTKYPVKMSKDNRVIRDVATMVKFPQYHLQTCGFISCGRSVVAGSPRASSSHPCHFFTPQGFASAISSDSRGFRSSSCSCGSHHRICNCRVPASVQTNSHSPMASSSSSRQSDIQPAAYRHCLYHHTPQSYPFMESDHSDFYVASGQSSGASGYVSAQSSFHGPQPRTVGWDESQEYQQDILLPANNDARIQKHNDPQPVMPSTSHQVGQESKACQVDAAVCPCPVPSQTNPNPVSMASSSNQVSTGYQVNTGQPVSTGHQVSTGQQVNAGQQVSAIQQVSAGLQVSKGNQVDTGFQVGLSLQVNKGNQYSKGHQVNAGQQVSMSHQADMRNVSPPTYSMATGHLPSPSRSSMKGATTPSPSGTLSHGSSHHSMMQTQPAPSMSLTPAQTYSRAGYSQYTQPIPSPSSHPATVQSHVSHETIMSQSHAHQLSEQSHASFPGVRQSCTRHPLADQVPKCFAVPPLGCPVHPAAQQQAGPSLCTCPSQIQCTCPNTYVQKKNAGRPRRMVMSADTCVGTCHAVNCTCSSQPMPGTSGQHQSRPTKRQRSKPRPRWVLSGTPKFTRSGKIYGYG